MVGGISKTADMVQEFLTCTNMVTALPQHSSLLAYSKNASMSVDSIFSYVLSTPARRVMVLCRKGAYVPWRGIPNRREVFGPSARAASRGEAAAADMVSLDADEFGVVGL